MNRRRAAAFVLGAGLALAPCVALAGEAPGAVALESRLYAPCCYGGTLDVHDSELARELRAEIERRLASGETSDAIQTDFVARYGERVLAARSDAPMRDMTLWFAVLFVGAAAGLGVLLRRWSVRSVVSAPARAGAVDELDERIDAELADVE